MRYEIPDSHPFFQEILHFNIAVVTSMSTLVLRACQEQIIEMVDAINFAQNKGVKVSGKLAEHNILEIIPLRSVSSDEELLIENARAIYSYLTTPKTKPPDKLIFTLKTVSEPWLSSPPDGMIRREGPDPRVYFEFLSCSFIGGAYEKTKDEILSWYPGGFRSFPPIFQFFRLLRNGCFHKNKFSVNQIGGRPQIDPTASPSWHTYIMHSDNSIDGKQTVGGIFKLIHVLPFLYDVGIEIERHRSRIIP